MKITITPTSLYFEDLNEKQFEELKGGYHINIKIDNKGRYVLTDTPEKLFKTLLKLSYDYDIELA